MTPDEKMIWTALFVAEFRSEMAKNALKEYDHDTEEDVISGAACYASNALDHMLGTAKDIRNQIHDGRYRRSREDISDLLEMFSRREDGKE